VQACGIPIAPEALASVIKDSSKRLREDAPHVGITLLRGDSSRSLVAGRARSRVGRDDVGDGSAAEGGGALGLDGEGFGEQPLAATEGDREGHETA
jgi:hypothetical protein